MTPHHYVNPTKHTNEEVEDDRHHLLLKSDILVHLTIGRDLIAPLLEIAFSGLVLEDIDATSQRMLTRGMNQIWTEMQIPIECRANQTFQIVGP